MLSTVGNLTVGTLAHCCLECGMYDTVTVYISPHNEKEVISEMPEVNSVVIDGLEKDECYVGFTSYQENDIGRIKNMLAERERVR